jgi:hypothetical protein
MEGQFDQFSGEGVAQLTHRRTRLAQFAAVGGHKIQLLGLSLLGAGAADMKQNTRDKLPVRT